MSTFYEEVYNQDLVTYIYVYIYIYIYLYIYICMLYIYIYILYIYYINITYLYIYIYIYNICGIYHWTIHRSSYGKLALLDWYLNPRPPLCNKCPFSELFRSAFPCIRAHYGEIRSISLYSVQMRENTA